MNNLFYTTGSKEDEFICISNLDEEGVEHLVCSEGAQAAFSEMIFYKLQLSDMLGLLIPQLEGCVCTVFILKLLSSCRKVNNF